MVLIQGKVKGFLPGLLFDAKQLYDMDGLKLFKNLILILWQGIQKVHRKK